MDTRDRLEEVGKNLDQKGADYDDGKSLINDYIKEEEIWACTTCNACVEACPILIDPLSIILDLRRFKVMEESAAPGRSGLGLGHCGVAGGAWPVCAVPDRLGKHFS